MRWPDFLIIGATKSGTTSLYHYLDQHPDIFMSPFKEPHFFSYEGQSLAYNGPGDAWLNTSAVTDSDAYGQLFDPAKPAQQCGEASAMYIYSEKAPQRMQHYNPDLKLIAILRNPVDRAYSSFMHLRRDGREPLQHFQEALDAEEKRITAGWAPIWHYKQMGFYARQLKAYQFFLERGQLQVFLFEELKSEPARVFKVICHFLGVDETFCPDFSLQYNRSGVPKSRILHNFLRQPHGMKELLKPLIPSKLREKLVMQVRNRNLNAADAMPDETRTMLQHFYKQDILELDRMVEGDFSKWLSQLVVDGG